MTYIPVVSRCLADALALDSIERALATTDTSERHLEASVALNLFEGHIDAFGLAGATAVLRHCASASRARRVELADMRRMKAAVFRERAADRMAVAA